MSDMKLMTRDATGIAISILAKLQDMQENNSEPAGFSDEDMEAREAEFPGARPYRETRYERRTDTRTADLKRLLVATTKLIVNEA